MNKLEETDLILVRAKKNIHTQTQIQKQQSHES